MIEGLRSVPDQQGRFTGRPSNNRSAITLSTSDIHSNSDEFDARLEQST